MCHGQHCTMRETKHEETHAKEVRHEGHEETDRQKDYEERRNKNRGKE